MKIFGSIIIWLALILLIFEILWVYSVSSRFIPKKIWRISRPDLSFTDVVVSEIAGQTKYWELKAKTAEINRATQTTKMGNIIGVFFERNSPVLEVEAPQAALYMDTRNISLTEPVLRNSPQSKRKQNPDFRMEAGYLLWYAEKKQVDCGDGIKLTTDGLVIKGRQMKTSLNLREIEISGQPQATIHFPNNGE